MCIKEKNLVSSCTTMLAWYVWVGKLMSRDLKIYVGIGSDRSPAYHKTQSHLRSGSMLLQAWQGQ